MKVVTLLLHVFLFFQRKMKTSSVTQMKDSSQNKDRYLNVHVLISSNLKYIEPLRNLVGGEGTGTIFHALFRMVGTGNLIDSK